MFYGYARVSTSEQSDTSIEIQLDKLRKVAEEMNEQFTPMSEKSSGKSTEGRDIFSRLLATITKGDILGVYDISRFGRNMLESLTNLYNISERGARVYDYSNRQFVDPNNPSSFLTYNINASIADYQRKMQMQKSRESMQKQREDGDMYLRGDTFGYNSTVIKGKRYISINEEEAKYVRLIYEGIANGMTIGQLAKKYEHVKFRDSKFTLKPHFIRRMIYKPIYMGYYTRTPMSELNWNTGTSRTINTVTKVNRETLEKELVKSNYYEPIVNSNYWWKVFEVQRTRTIPHATPHAYRVSPYELTGIIKCPECGKGFVHCYIKRGGYEAYTLSVHRADCTFKKYITIRKYIIEYLMRVCFFLTYLDTEHVGKMFVERKEELETDKADITQQIESIRRRYGELDNQLDNLAEQSATTTIPRFKDKLEKQADSISSEMTTLERDLNYYTQLLRDKETEFEDLLKEESENLIEKFIHADESGRRDIYIKSCNATVSSEWVKIGYNNGLRYKIRNHTIYNEKCRRKPFLFVMEYKGEEILSGSINPDDNVVEITPMEVKGKDKEFIIAVNKHYDELARKVTDYVNQAIAETKELRKFPLTY